MADHPAVVAARAATGPMFQHTLVLSPHVGPQPAGRTLPTKADDPTPILSAIAGLGWDLVTAAPIPITGSTAVTCVYVWRRR